MTHCNVQVLIYINMFYVNRLRNSKILVPATRNWTRKVAIIKVVTMFHGSVSLLLYIVFNTY